MPTPSLAFTYLGTRLATIPIFQLGAAHGFTSCPYPIVCRSHASLAFALTWTLIGVRVRVRVKVRVRVRVRVTHISPLH